MRKRIITSSPVVSAPPPFGLDVAALATVLVTSESAAHPVDSFSAPRKEFDFLLPNDIKLVLQLWDPRQGRRQFRITSSELVYPPSPDFSPLDGCTGNPGWTLTTSNRVR